MRVALFTSYSPAIGGGAVNLRSLLPHLSGMDVIWFHLGAEVTAPCRCVSLGRPLVGGRIFSDIFRTPLLWVGSRQMAVRSMADRIIAAQADRHWIIAMDEGIPLGLMLARRAPTVPLHVSIQDDQELGMYRRSWRYCIFARLTRAPFRRLLHVATSVDVTSDEMQRYYAHRFGLASTVVHPVIAQYPVEWDSTDTAGTLDQLRLGHIGSIYSAPELVSMLIALKLEAAALGRKPTALFIGLPSRFHRIVQRSGVAVELMSNTTEKNAVTRLRQCSFVYAMYPFDNSSEVFRTTSLPTKLTTYVRAGRPIFAHTPADSTLARTVSRFQLGVVCDCDNVEGLRRAIGDVISQPVPQARFGALRDNFYGLDNAQKLQRLLSGTI